MKNKNNILVSGLHGLVGSKFYENYHNKYNLIPIDINDPDNPVDITNYQQVRTIIKESEAKILIHLAAFTNVDLAWKERGRKDGLVYQVNVEGTKNIIKACEEFKVSLIYISTAFVFDGEKKGLYTEEDMCQPIEWYGKTKYWGEEATKSSESPWVILRIDKPFRDDIFTKKDEAHAKVQALKKNSLPPQFTNHYFGPTYIEDFVKVMDFFIRERNNSDLWGEIYHATSGEKWSDYEFTKTIKNLHDLPGEVKKGDLETYLKSCQRPYQVNTALDNSKLEKILDFKLTPIKKALKKLKI